MLEDPVWGRIEIDYYSKQRGYACKWKVRFSAAVAAEALRLSYALLRTHMFPAKQDVYDRSKLPQPPQPR